MRLTRNNIKARLHIVRVLPIPGLAELNSSQPNLKTKLQESYTNALFVLRDRTLLSYVLSSRIPSGISFRWENTQKFL